MIVVKGTCKIKVLNTVDHYLTKQMPPWNLSWSCFSFWFKLSFYTLIATPLWPSLDLKSLQHIAVRTIGHWQETASFCDVFHQNYEAMDVLSPVQPKKLEDIKASRCAWLSLKDFLSSLNYQNISKQYLEICDGILFGSWDLLDSAGKPCLWDYRRQRAGHGWCWCGATAWL